MEKLLRATNLILIAVFILGLTSTAYADSADVLPKGRSRVSVSGAHYFPIDTRFDPDGNEEDIATDYNTTLGSNIFPDLAGFENAQGGPLPDGWANVGASRVSFEITAEEFTASYQYGLTDKLTVGVQIPYSFYKRKVKSAIKTNGVATDGVPLGTVGKNPFYDPANADPNNPNDPRWYPLVPGGVLLTTDDVKDLLSGGLDVNGDGQVDIMGYGYERFKTWSDDGIGDITVGGRYQYLNNDQWRLAFTGGIRMPTGNADNPDNLLDMPFGTGAWAILFQFQNDYKATENLVLNFSLKYDLVLPDRVTLRVPDDVNIPITVNKEKVDRDLGDQFKLDTSATYQFNDSFSASIQYQYWNRLKDKVDGNKGYAYESLEDETDKTAHIFLIGVSYSTISQFLEKKFPVPLEASVTYENVFAGSNNFLKQDDIILHLSVYF